MNPDPFTAAMRLCDAAGMISHEPVDPPNPLAPGLTYCAQHNNLRGVTGHEPWTGEPFACTGHAHLAHMHILCTSPAHNTLTPSAGERAKETKP